MKLELGNEQVLDDPTADHVAGALHALTDSFAILSPSDFRFMQCCGGWKEGFILEYQDGSTDDHFQCTDRELTLASVIEAMQSYLDDDDRWRTMFQWQKLNLRRRS